MLYLISLFDWREILQDLCSQFRVKENTLSIREAQAIKLPSKQKQKNRERQTDKIETFSEHSQSTNKTSGSELLKIKKE